MKKGNKLLTLMLVFVLALSIFALAGCKDPEDNTPAAAKGAYIFSDKATYLSYKNSSSGDQLPNLSILYENDESLKNTYTMIAINPDAPFTSSTSGEALTGDALANVKAGINTEAADIFIKWMSLASTRTDLIAKYGKDFGTNFGENLFSLLPEAQTYAGTVAELKTAADALANKTLRISSTSSVRDSGLMENKNDATAECLVKSFKEATGITIEATYKGTGDAIKNAQFGNADLIIVHAKADEQNKVCKTGFSRVVTGLTGTPVDAEYTARIPFMYNYFVLVGPSADPAGVKNAASAKAAFKLISDGGYNFISRGDSSGTHKAEIKLWDSALGITVDATSFSEYSWYISAATTMGACLTMADQTDPKAA